MFKAASTVRKQTAKHFASESAHEGKNSGHQNDADNADIEIRRHSGASLGRK